ncbi:AAA family ATPase, partial [Salmonella enterica subsp. enterica serovar Typhimurium]|nr:AAA family ATPase [Salmonella enterica subsp. enterica serovar Typhimurium]
IGDGDIDQNDGTRRILNAIETLVIDEISMVNADLMDAIDRSLRQARGRRGEPFGGVQIVMFGDPYQLAPVPPRGDEARYVKDHYRSFWFFDAKVWAGPSTSPSTDSGTQGALFEVDTRAELHVRELVQIHRQSDDGFKSMLNAVRYGRVTA